MSNRRLLTEVPAARWSILILASFIMATNYYFYDLLAPIQDLVRIKLGFSASDFGMVMSAYAIPNVFLAMAILGGIILDRIGIRVTGFSFIFLMCLGGALTAYAASPTFLEGGFGYGFLNSFLTGTSPQLKMMVLGFFLFGLGAETSIVVLSKIIVKWFKEREIALALGLNLAIGRLGAALAFTLTPRLVQPEWTTGIYFGVLLLWIGLLGFILYMLIDARVDRQVRIDLTDPEETFRLRDLQTLVTNRSVIYITLLCVTFYSAIFPFLKFAPDLLMNKYSMAREMAGDVTAYLMYGTIVLTPLFGWFADNRGKSATMMYLGSALLIVAHLMFALTHLEPRIPIVLLGIAFSLVPAAMWPAVTKIVPTTKLGTAYGFMFSVQNVGLFLFPWLIGYVVDVSNPHYRVVLTAEEFAVVQQHDMAYSGTYLDARGRPLARQAVLVNVLISEDFEDGSTVWSESHRVTTDEQGEFTITFGRPDTWLSVDFTQLDRQVRYQAELTTSSGKEPERVLFRGDFKMDDNQTFMSLLGDDVRDMKHGGYRGIIKLLNEEGRSVWEEQTRFFVDQRGQFRVVMGQGTVRYADPEYFGLFANALTATIIMPLNYTNPMLVFSALGMAGLLFAYLLKREDRTSGYGLELPNKMKAERP